MNQQNEEISYVKHEDRGDWRHGAHGSKVVKKLGDRGYDVVAASPNSGVNTLTDEGLAEVLKGASVVVDVSNSPSFDDEPACASLIRISSTLTCSSLSRKSSQALKQPESLKL